MTIWHLLLLAACAPGADPSSGADDATTEDVGAQGADDVADAPGDREEQSNHSSFSDADVVDLAIATEDPTDDRWWSEWTILAPGVAVRATLDGQNREVFGAGAEGLAYFLKDAEAEVAKSDAWGDSERADEWERRADGLAAMLSDLDTSTQLDRSDQTGSSDGCSLKSSAWGSRKYHGDELFSYLGNALGSVSCSSAKSRILYAAARVEWFDGYGASVAKSKVEDGSTSSKTSTTSKSACATYNITSYSSSYWQYACEASGYSLVGSFAKSATSTCY